MMAHGSLLPLYESDYVRVLAVYCLLRIRNMYVYLHVQCTPVPTATTKKRRLSPILNDEHQGYIYHTNEIGTFIYGWFCCCHFTLYTIYLATADIRKHCKKVNIATAAQPAAIQVFFFSNDYI